MAEPEAPSRSPLSGIRVLDFTTFLGGPFAGMLLADLGAEVVKIESPAGGDPSRNRQDHAGYSSTYAGVNRNKASLALDLKNPAARPLLERLVRQSDALLVSVRPKSRPEIGLDYPTLQKINPRLVYCSITGYGESEAAVDRPAFDTTAQAISGLLSLVLGKFDHEVTITAFLSDLLAGLYAANGVLAAIVERQTSGLGQEVRTSLLEASLGFETFNFFTLFAAQAAGRQSKNVRPAGYLLHGSDGKPFAVHVPPSPEKLWKNFVAALELPWLDEDARFVSKAARATNYPILHRIVAEHVQTGTRDHWLARLAEHEVACAPINTLAEVFDHPIVRSLGMQHGFSDPWGRPQKTVGSGVRFLRTPTAVPRRAPLLGEDCFEVLRAAGYSDAEIAAFRQAGAVGEPQTPAHLGPDTSTDKA